MNSFLKELEQTKDSDEHSQAVVKVTEEDLQDALASFAKGMNDEERMRFIGIYQKYQNKGDSQANAKNMLKNQK